MTDGNYVDGSYFFYAPNKGAPFFFTAAFAGSAILHFWQCYRYKFFKVTGLFPFCCLLFTAGFAVRITDPATPLDQFAHETQALADKRGRGLTFSCVSRNRPLLELANYHILGRVLYYVPYCSPLHPGRVLSTFAFFSVIVGSLNGWGGSYSANQSLSPREMAAGHALIKASLLLQVFVVVCFVVLAATFQRRCARAGVACQRGVRGPRVTLYVSAGLILARTAFRIVEYFGVAAMRRGPDVDVGEVPPAMRYEWLFYVFEAGLMLANVVMFNARHPRRYLPEKYTVYLAWEWGTEVDGPGWKESKGSEAA
ncbi:RTA1 domain-containing protein [Colletotrichum graminicola M1.001]|uniref:RTA1 domain-containing protein n=1 Tax=Colletotrichum graminicola (strain M1.001 / M2 / FGSC 10212) TaxID=645133 RepID=E3QHY7_COLGM|nr:RTA1 domain-containing protein [Colletotrichum graminicola M1.001]EFQ30475.1 RTA1 domain-containing protein [Colletotrichum graminicola M1.001]